MADVVVTTGGGTSEIRLNRPEQKNAFTSAMYEAVGEALLAGEADPDVRVHIITGGGEDFSAGNDIYDFLERGLGDLADRGRPSVLTVLDVTEKPVVAAVNGNAVGVGATMLLHCDLVYASTTARFLFPFINLALVPEFGSSLLLPAVVGRHRAAELLMLGEPFGAEKAREMGLVNAVTDGDALDLAREAAAKLVAKPPTAIRLTKRLLSSRAPLEERMQRELEYFGSQLASDEARAAMAALVDRWKAQDTLPPR